MSIARDLASGSGIEAGEVVPHIIPGVLYPAVAGKLLDGSTSHSGNYGTAQADGFSYYYTDIKGSKPIKDPRIGAHFGSQRYKAKSVQLLEQETATHGTNTYSIDGREWFRAVSSDLEGWHLDLGGFIGSSNHTFITFFEIVGYFNDFNCISRTKNDRADDINITVNGGTTRNSANTDKLAGKSVENSPLRNRYVDGGSVINHGDSDVTSDLGTTPRINTIKIEAINTGNKYWQFFGIELIAQDTTSTANRSKIQIPSQNVVSYGKKFTVSGTPHYDPFNGMSGAKTLAQLGDYIDTATSLGMDNWKAGTANYYKPFNGGRVVKWVDSSGTIKTSVTMMPPNAQNIGTTASNAFSDGEVQAGTNDHTITFNTTAIDHSLSEVAKTFMAMEFGNGSANGNATYADATMLNTDGTADDIAYVMDDGLTSLSADNTARSVKAIIPNADNDFNFFTFIGTGISINDPNGDSPGQYYPAQNMPYGTHILKSTRKSGTDAVEFIIDGVNLGTQSNCTKGRCEEVTFYQPKKPPIPEDAVIIADYMLMADYVGVPASDSGQHNTIPKGTRMCSASRDAFYNTASGTLEFQQSGIGVRERVHRVQFNDVSSSSKEGPLITYFGHPKMSYGMASDTDASPKYELKIADSTTNVTGVTTSGSVSGANVSGFKVDGTSYQHISSSKSDGTLGSQTAQIRCDPDDSNDNHLYFCDAYIPTPIHTSSHYQTFETPFLHELVGGDRNMEQTNLVVTPDGKSWDEVTRDTSYLGDMCINTNTDTSFTSSSSNVIFDDWRGTITSKNTQAMNKDFAIAYDRMICLVQGQYKISSSSEVSGSGVTQQIKVNGTPVGNMARHTDVPCQIEAIVHLKRGDYVQYIGAFFGGQQFNYFHIVRI